MNTTQQYQVRLERLPQRQAGWRIQQAFEYAYQAGRMWEATQVEIQFQEADHVQASSLICASIDPAARAGSNH